MQDGLKNQIGAALEASLRGETTTGAIELLTQLKCVPGFAKSLLEILVDQSVVSFDTRFCYQPELQQVSRSKSSYLSIMITNQRILISPTQTNR